MEKGVLDTPILLILFNRPDHTKEVIRTIRKVRPRRVYLAADGPRPGKPEDLEKCEATRKVALEHIDWECEVKTRFQAQNLGCGQNPSQAISWMLEEEPYGIILEDDCIPNESFFWFCEYFLKKFEDDERIWMVSGTNMNQQWKPEQWDYFFSLIGSTWGWATWRRAWKHYDYHMADWANPQVQELMKNMLEPLVYKVISMEYQYTYEGYYKGSVWDFQWNFMRMMNNGLTVMPAYNLVSNVGFGEEATHTKGEGKIARIPREELSFPLRENPIFIPDFEFDRVISFADDQRLWNRATRKINTLVQKVFN